MGTIYFTSDLHLGHEAMIYKLHRPFETLEQMNQQLIDNINETVGQGDTLYILGDLSYRMRRDDVVACVQRIQCQQVHLLRGNHDKDFEGMELFASIGDYKELRYGPDNRRFCLFHFPIKHWAGERGGSVQLHGHIHTKGTRYNEANFQRKHWQYDVGVDANDYKPVSIDAILDLLALHNV